MSNEIFKIGDVVEVMPSHAQTWKNDGKIAIGHRFIIKNAERWNNANVGALRSGENRYSSARKLTAAKLKN